MASDKEKGYTIAVIKPDIYKAKGKIIEKLSNEKTNRSTVLRLDSTRMQFSCVIGDFECSSKNGHAVKAWAESELRKPTKEALLDWKPVIEMKVELDKDRWYRSGRGKRDHMDSELKVSASRYYVARKSRDGDGNEIWLSLEWDQADPKSPGKLDDADMLAAARSFRSPRDDRFDRLSPAERRGWFRLPSKDGETYYVPYSQELWEGTTLLLQQMKAAAENIDAMFRSKEGHAKLASLGQQQPLLSSGGK